MWRVQVWEGKHIVEAFLFDTEQEARDKKYELIGIYWHPKYLIKVEEFVQNPPKKENEFLVQIIGELLNPFNWGNH